MPGIGPLATQLGRSAYLPCPCTGTGGAQTNQITDLSVGPGGSFARAGAVISTMKATRSSSRCRRPQQQRDHRPQPVQRADHRRHGQGGGASQRWRGDDDRRQHRVDLRPPEGRLGTVINGSVAANTRINLAGIGTVTLNRVARSGNFTESGRITVEMISVTLAAGNILGLPAGARVVVAHADAGFVRTPADTIVAGQAFAARANATIGSTLAGRIGRAAYVTLPCEGTSGRTRTNNVNTLNVTGILSLGTGVSTAKSTSTATSTTATTTATIESVNLLGGLIQATALKAVAQTTLTGSTRTRSAAGSGFASLRVLGLPVAVSVAPNTRINLPLIGYVVINEQILPAASSSARTVVNGLRIVVTLRDNPLQLPVGSEIVVAHADAGVSR
ncbi:MAG: choice-of-anchor P family protein [Geminicoccaceae bacterium]